MRARPLALLLPALLLTGCAATASPAQSPEASPDSVRVSNCGVDVAFPVAPKRVVAIKSTSIEMLLALGLRDRIVGTAFADGPVPEPWAAEAADLPVLAPQMPSEEAVLQLRPDLVYAGWESAFTPDAAGDRAELAALGVAGYVQPAACRSAGAPARLDFSEVFAEIQQVADIFRVDAAALLQSQRDELAAIAPDGRGLTALWYSSGTDIPYVGGGTGAPQLLLDTVGLTNIAADLPQTWGSLGWEAIVAANPDVIVLVDASWNTAESKRQALEANPATARLDAVVNGRYLVIPFAASEAGVRSVSAATSLAQQLAALP